MHAPRPVPTQTILDPYIGLRPYTDSDDDCARFFGREQEQEIIIANLYATSLTVFYGASGVGKSSVLLAGVVPKLRQTPRFACVVFRTWQLEKVLPQLKAEILRSVQIAAKQAVGVDPAMALDDFLLECARVLRGRVVLIFDQFEEYFLYHGPSAVSEGFEAEFARSVNRSEIDASFLLSMREDGLGKLDRFQGRIPNLLNNLLRLDHLGRDAAIRAIREPLEACNKRLSPGDSPASIEEDLVKALLEQLKTGTVTLDHARQPAQALTAAAQINNEMWIETPFLQVVLTRIWDEEKRHGSRRLRLATLNKLGGAFRILRTYLDKTMRKLKRRHRRIAVDIFGYLVTPSGSKIAHTVADLASYSRRRESRLSPLLDRLSDSNIRVLRTISPAPGEAEGVRYEIFHDVLAAAILTWRRRKLVWRRVWRVVRWTLGVGAAVFCILLLVGAAVLQEQKKTKAALGSAKDALGIVGRLDKAIPYFQAVMRGHRGPIFKVALSPDGKRLATASSDTTARVWDIETGKEILQLRGHTQGISDVVFSPDGKLIATCAPDNTASLWDAASGNLIHKLEGYDKPVSIIAFKRDGSLVLTAGQDGTARIWDVTSGKEQLKLQHDHALNSAVFSPLGERILTACVDGTAWIWNPSNGTKVELHGHTGSIFNAMFSPDGELAVTASLDRTARTWDAKTGRAIATLSGHADVVLNAAFSPDSQFVATTSADDTSRIWNARSGAMVSELRGHTDYVWNVAFSPDGRRLVTGSEDNTARIWDTTSGKLEAVLRGHTRDVTAVAFSPNGNFIITGSMDGTARVWTNTAARSVVTLNHGGEIYRARWSSDSRLLVTASSDRTAGVWRSDGTLIAILEGHDREVRRAELSADNALVVTASRDNTAAVWNALTGKKIASLAGHKSWVSAASFSPGGHFIVTTSLDGTARLWDRNSGALLHTLPHADEVNCAAFSSDDKVLITGCQDGKVTAWETQTGKAFLDMPGHIAGIRAVAFSPVNDQCLLTVSDDWDARIWHVSKGAKPIRLGKHAGGLTNGRFSPDGTMVVTASRDCSARVWEVATGEPISVLEHSDDVSDAAFSPDSKLVVTASGDGSACVWEVRTGRRLAELREHLSAVNSAEFSPDGKFILTASTDHTARIWKVGDW
jgi:WD40 repeat protein